MAVPRLLQQVGYSHDRTCQRGRHPRWNKGGKLPIQQLHSRLSAHVQTGKIPLLKQTGHAHLEVQRHIQQRPCEARSNIHRSISVFFYHKEGGSSAPDSAYYHWDGKHHCAKRCHLKAHMQCFLQKYGSWSLLPSLFILLKNVSYLATFSFAG